ELGDKVAILPITYQKEDLIAGFLGNPRYQALKDISTRSIVGDSTLHQAFPSQSLPHIVIIDSRGRVSAMTQAAYINAENLAALYGSEQETYFPRYKKYHHDQFLDISPA